MSGLPYGSEREFGGQSGGGSGSMRNNNYNTTVVAGTPVSNPYVLQPTTSRHHVSTDGDEALAIAIQSSLYQEGQPPPQPPRHSVQHAGFVPAVAHQQGRMGQPGSTRVAFGGPMHYIHPQQQQKPLVSRPFCVTFAVLGVVLATLLIMVAVLMVNAILQKECTEPCLCWQTTTQPAEEHSTQVTLHGGHDCPVSQTGDGRWQPLCSDHSLHMEYQWTGTYPLQLRCAGNQCVSGADATIGVDESITASEATSGVVVYSRVTNDVSYREALFRCDDLRGGLW